MSAIPGSINLHPASAPPGEEGDERKDSYKVLDALVDGLISELKDCERENLVRMNNKVKEVNLNHPCVAAIWEVAKRVEKLFEETIDEQERKKVAQLQVRVVGIQAWIYDTPIGKNCTIL